MLLASSHGTVWEGHLPLARMRTRTPHQSKKRSTEIALSLAKLHPKRLPAYTDSPMRIGNREHNCSSLLMELATAYFRPQGPDQRAKREFTSRCEWAETWLQTLALPLFMARLASTCMRDDDLCGLICAQYGDKMPDRDDEVAIPLGSAACVKWKFRPWDWLLKCATDRETLASLSPEKYDALLSLHWFESAIRLLKTTSGPRYAREKEAASPRRVGSK